NHHRHHSVSPIHSLQPVHAFVWCASSGSLGTSQPTSAHYRRRSWPAVLWAGFDPSYYQGSATSHAIKRSTATEELPAWIGSNASLFSARQATPADTSCDNSTMVATESVQSYAINNEHWKQAPTMRQHSMDESMNG